MLDCSFKVDIGADQTRPFIVWTTEKKLARRNLTDGTVRAYFYAPFAEEPVLMKTLSIDNAEQGVCLLTLTPVETRLFRKPLRVSMELRQGGKELIIGRGTATGLGGGNLDG